MKAPCLLNITIELILHGNWRSKSIGSIFARRTKDGTSSVGRDVGFTRSRCSSGFQTPREEPTAFESIPKIISSIAELVVGDLFRVWTTRRCRTMGHLVFPVPSLRASRRLPRAFSRWISSRCFPSLSFQWHSFHHGHSHSTRPTNPEILSQRSSENPRPPRTAQRLRTARLQSSIDVAVGILQLRLHDALLCLGPNQVLDWQQRSAMESFVDHLWTIGEQETRCLHRPGQNELLQT